MSPRGTNDPEELSLSFSLLHPEGKRRESSRLDDHAIADLGVERLVDCWTEAGPRRPAIREFLVTLCRDPETLEYRLDVIEDLLSNNPLREGLAALVPAIGKLRYFSWRPDRDDKTPLQEVVWRLRELEHYVDCISILQTAFSGVRPRSAGLGTLDRIVSLTAADPTFISLRQTLPELLKTINSLRSIAIGVNLDGALLPHEATILSLGSANYTGDTLFGRLLGGDQGRGLAQLHKASETEYALNPLMVPLFNDLAVILDRTVKPVAASLKAFVGIKGKLFVKLQDEFLFYQGTVELIRRLRDLGLPMCRPQVAPEEDRTFHGQGLYNLNLALHLGKEGPPIVSNDLALDQAGRIAVLTGPNRGGKTTFIQAVGLAQVLFQAGLYVPADRARLSPVDALLTHYPALEEPDKDTGRFGEEAQRLQVIFTQATRGSLFLMNESFSSTSMGEGLYLAADLLRVCRMLGCRVVFATHLHQLAAEVEEINASVGGDSILMSLAAGIEEERVNGALRIRPTFKIHPGPPAGKSYALDLADRYGIGRDQLLEGLRRRGVLDSRDRP